MISRPPFETSVPPSPLALRTTRRGAIGLAGLGLAAAFGLASLAGCGREGGRQVIDVSGSSPPLAFTMTRASDGREVTQADYRGRIVMLYFGYTFCPDVCPTTLMDIASVLKRLGAQAKQVSVLFVTVDPTRDTLPVLADYAKAFAPEIDGLRGNADQLVSLARRYRIVYSVSPQTKDHPYEVTHGSGIYVFDGSGAARFLVPSLAVGTQDLSGVTDDLRRLIEGKNPPKWWARWMDLV